MMHLALVLHGGLMLMSLVVFGMCHEKSRSSGWRLGGFASSRCLALRKTVRPTAFVVLFEACVWLYAFGMNMVVIYWYFTESCPVKAAV